MLGLRRGCHSAARTLRSMHTQAKQGGVSSVVLAGPILLTTGLGVWQVQRTFWKQELMEQREKRFREPARELDSMPAVRREIDAKELESFQVRLDGQVDPGYAAFIGPRSPPAGTRGGSNAATTTTGYLLVQPVTTAGGRRVLVNRGWVPKAMRGQALAELQPKTEFCGVVHVSDQPSAIVADMIVDSGADSSQKDYMWRDVVGMARHFGTEPVCVDVIDPEEGSERNAKEMYQDGVVVPVAPKLEPYFAVRCTPATHMQYATTWFTLSVAMSVIALRARKGNTKGLFWGK
eukprot:TRINITY_DN38854_c0_g1_i1.p1 TRINITY_DN38854_c0_g1~~TRINITY_DN38854_c0_g1_i1.p1  ORF type:complete len:291 (-),score=82.25 TRINITY_DN38854_c0_g1_i1:189-1061(-)